MAEPDPRPTRSRGNTSAAASRRSGASRSRPSSPAPLTRYVSGNYIDDQALYHDHAEDEKADLSQETLNNDTEADDESILQDSESGESAIAEVRDGIRDERDRDLEGAREGRLEREKSRRSARERDPNLVTWTGPDDGLNPKNWSTGRKWAATFVGEFACSD